MITIVGMDPSLSSTGWGILEYHEDSSVDARWGTIRTKGDDIDARLRILHDAAAEIALKAGDEWVAVFETPFMRDNAQTAIKLGQAQAALSLGLSSQSGLVAIHRYDPRKVKMVVTGIGSAKKEVVRDALVQQLDLGEAPSSLDASDALAIAHTHYLLTRGDPT